MIGYGIYKVVQRVYFEQKEEGSVLIGCTIPALLIADSSIGETFVPYLDSKLDLSFSQSNLNYSTEHWVNDGLMAIFLHVGTRWK